MIDITSTTDISPALPSDASWDGSKWVITHPATHGVTFNIISGAMVGQQPNFFYVNVTINSEIIDNNVLILLDSSDSYQWDDPVYFAYERTFPVGTYTIGVDLFNDGINSHLGDIVRLQFSGDFVTGITQINQIFFSDEIIDPPPAVVLQTWHTYINTTEITS